MGPLEITPFLKYESCLFDHRTRKGGISRAYSSLSDHITVSVLPFQMRWERDLQESFSEDEWLRAFQLNLKNYHCINHLETNRKLPYRWFLTPYHLAKMSAQHSTICWRCNRQTGSMMHIWWSWNRGESPLLTSIHPPFFLPL
ncbi:hypothetical protein GDO78_009721 [Eleutherodactylus coqui]|uniref:Uncharacterized protein n=1 Tax=Eleutherodactylus coqui TaxID=57060 RepID=A0A8J6FBW9_ELECQ|nr:hypothetical protein GDO78_009721 [Eleutherodactylus coqui]